MPSRQSTIFLSAFVILCVLASQRQVSIDLFSLIQSFQEESPAAANHNETSNATTIPDSLVSKVHPMINGSATIQDLEYYRKHRLEQWDSWFETKDKVKDNADANGTILDFVIAGFPKCGTTTMEGKSRCVGAHASRGRLYATCKHNLLCLSKLAKQVSR